MFRDIVFNIFSAFSPNIFHCYRLCKKVRQLPSDEKIYSLFLFCRVLGYFHWDAQFGTGTSYARTMWPRWLCPLSRVWPSACSLGLFWRCRTQRELLASEWHIYSGQLTPDEDKHKQALHCLIFQLDRVTSKPCILVFSLEMHHWGKMSFQPHSQITWQVDTQAL